MQAILPRKNQEEKTNKELPILEREAVSSLIFSDKLMLSQKGQVNPLSLW
jgi:hypothetical protein